MLVPDERMIVRLYETEVVPRLSVQSPSGFIIGGRFNLPRERVCLKMTSILKKRKKLTVFILALSLLALVGCSGNNDDGVLELKLAHFFPVNHPAEIDLVQPWAAAIEEATEGRVKIISFPAGTLAQSDAIYEGVKKGIADIGMSCFSYTRGQFPVLEVFELPGIIYNTSDMASRIAWEGVKLLDPVEVQDTKLMMVLTTGSGDLFTKVPIRNINDLQGMEIRATGLSAATLKALGATPVAMPQADAYEAMSKGVVRGNLGPIEVLKGWRQAEVTSYITKTPFLYNTLFFLTMNTDKWNSISAADQEAILKINDRFFEEVACGLWDMQNEDALKYAVEEGLQVIELSQEEQDLWISLVKPIQEDFASRMDALGFPGQEILDTVLDLAEKFN